MTQRSQRAPLLVLWALAGALLGVGVIAILSIGVALLLLGVILAAIAAWLSWGRGLWAILIGFGLAPAAFLVFDIVTAPPPCPTQPVVITSGSYTCADIPPSYADMAVGFLAVALIGALIPLASRLRRAMRPDAHPRAADVDMS
jgi:hypothetical protein